METALQTVSNESGAPFVHFTEAPAWFALAFASCFLACQESH